MFIFLISSSNNLFPRFNSLKILLKYLDQNKKYPYYNFVYISLTKVTIIENFVRGPTETEPGSYMDNGHYMY